MQRDDDVVVKQGIDDVRMFSAINGIEVVLSLMWNERNQEFKPGQTDVSRFLFCCRYPPSWRQPPSTAVNYRRRALCSRQGMNYP